jgi:hypothetical protein
VRKRATESKQYGAAVSALKEIGILTGLRVERQERGQPGEFDHLSDEELKAEIMRLVQKLDLMGNDGSTGNVVPLRGHPKGEEPTGLEIGTDPLPVAPCWRA